MNDYGKAVREILKTNGCRFLRQGRGDHEVWTGPNTAKPFTVPVKIKSRHTANGVLKDAGLPRGFEAQKRPGRPQAKVSTASGSVKLPT